MITNLFTETKKSIVLLLTILALFCSFNSTNTAYAETRSTISTTTTSTEKPIVILDPSGSTSRFSSSSPADELAYVKPMRALVDNLSGPVTKSIITITIAITGLMVCFGQTGGLFKTSLNVILGTAIALQATTFLADFGFGSLLHPDWSMIAGATAAKPVVYDPNNGSIIGTFMNAIIVSTQRGGVKLLPYCLQLMGFLVLIDLTLTLALGLAKEDKIKYMISTVLKVGFFMFLVSNWIDGTYQITQVIFKSFEKIGIIASGMDMGIYEPDNLVGTVIKLISEAYNNKPDTSNIATNLIWFVLLVGIFITSILTAMEIFIAKAEFYIISVISMPLVAFGLNKYTNWMSEKAIGAIFSAGIKVCVLNFCLCIGAPVLNVILETSMNELKKGDSVSWGTLIGAFISLYLLYKIISKAPTLAQGLISGSPALSKGNLGMSIAGLAAGAAAMAGQAGYVAGTMSQIKGAMSEGGSEGGGGGSIAGSVMKHATGALKTGGMVATTVATGGAGGVVAAGGAAAQAANAGTQAATAGMKAIQSGASAAGSTASSGTAAMGGSQGATGAGKAAQGTTSSGGGKQGPATNVVASKPKTNPSSTMNKVKTAGKIAGKLALYNTPGFKQFMQGIQRSQSDMATFNASFDSLKKGYTAPNERDDQMDKKQLDQLENIQKTLGALSTQLGLNTNTNQNTASQVDESPSDNRNSEEQDTSSSTMDLKQ